MELLNVTTARAIWLFDIAELNPRGKTLMPELLLWLKEEYHFEKAPTKPTELDEKTKSLLFEGGQFQAREEFFVDVTLKIFNDGIVGETQSSTHDSEAFLGDVLDLAVKEFGLTYKPERIRARTYVSELNAYSPKTLVGINPKLPEFLAKISCAIPPGAPKVNYDLGGVSFWSTSQPLPNSAVSTFRIERKIGSSATEQKYWSSAALHTDDHLRLLTEFEEIFMK